MADAIAFGERYERSRLVLEQAREWRALTHPFGLCRPTAPLTLSRAETGDERLVRLEREGKAVVGPPPVGATVSIRSNQTPGRRSVVVAKAAVRKLQAEAKPKQKAEAKKLPSRRDLQSRRNAKEILAWMDEA